MSFSFGSPPPSGGFTKASNDAQPQSGPDLEEVSTEGIGFQAIAGETKLRLLPSKWPADSLPPPYASLLSVASKWGLVAAAGPESVIVASTDNVRKAFVTPGEGNTRPFTPQLKLELGMRISQVAFSADEEYLVLSAENGGGLAVYEVRALLQGRSQTMFEMPTNGSPLRALVPNPTPEKAELFAVVTTSGQILMANLKTRQFLSGAQGQILKEGVSCISWSTRGKQLVAGLGDGTCYQMTPEGEAKASLPYPSGLEAGQYVSSLSWLENNLFLSAHTPSSSGPGPSLTTTYHVVNRQTSPQAGVQFQRLPEPCYPSGFDRSPPCQFMQRLKNFPPALSDAIVVASTASSDVGLFTRSEKPLSNEFPTEKITKVFTTTMMADDSRRAQLPVTDELTDTSPLGMAFDLSSKENVKRPLPQEEFNESSSPVPLLMILNHQGILAAWWLIYADSIREGLAFPGLSIESAAQAQQQQPAQRQLSSFAASTPQTTSAFGQSSFGSALSKPADTAFNPSITPKLGVSKFGSSSGLGQAQSQLNSSAASNTAAQSGPTSFGQPSFGSSTPLGGASQGVAFGQAGGLGNRASPWGATSTTPAAQGSLFGQTTGMGTRAQSFGKASKGATFDSSATSTPPSGGFAAFAAKSNGFLSAQPSSSAQSVFGKPAPVVSNEAGMDTDTTFRQTSTKEEPSKSTFGGAGFKLGSSFKRDDSPAKDQLRPDSAPGASMFGSSFGNTLGSAQQSAPTPQTKDDDMDDEVEGDSTLADKDSTTPAKVDTASPINEEPPKFLFKSDLPKSGGFFATQSQGKNTPALVQSSQPATSTFGKPTPITTTPLDTPKKPEDYPRPSVEPSPKIKKEPGSDEDEISPLNDEEAAPPEGYEKPDRARQSRSRTPETPVQSNQDDAPLPPESTSKTSYAPGDSSNSSKSSNDDAPMPPDFLPAKSKLQKVQNAPQVQTSLPGEDEDAGLDDEGSGIDVAQEVSPTTDANQSPRITPGSSFGALTDKGLVGNLPSSKPELVKGKSLFGEVSKISAPIFPLPSKAQGSPRSPSPVRSSLAADLLRPDSSRSISAPGPFNALANRKKALSQVVVPSKARPSTEDARKTERDRLISATANRAAEEEQELSDREDEQVREELATDVESTKTLDAFLAHQDYVGNITKPGIPGQIEKVYRDINSMIDTLGLNARSLKAFAKGHSQTSTKGTRSREDLESVDWCLSEIKALEDIESDLFEHLENGRLQEVQGKLDACRDLRRGVTYLRNKGQDMGRTIDLRNDADNSGSARSSPLSLEQASQQHQLRKKFAYFQKVLAEAEEKITILRARLSSCEPHNGKGLAMKQPTLEAVVNTIKKMTSMVEQKSGDIDVVEMQMRNLQLSTVEGQTSKGASPMTSATQSSRRSHTSHDSGKALVNGHANGVSHTKAPLHRPTNRVGTPRKQVEAMPAENRQQFQSRAQHRGEVNLIIKESFAKSGPKIRPLD